MKNNTLIIIALFFAANLLSGCYHSRNMATNTATTDSITTIIHERVVEVHDTAYIDIPVEVYRNITTDTSLLETSFALSEAFVDSVGMLHHSLENKPQTLKEPIVIYVPVSDTTHTESHDRESDQQQTVYIEKSLHWWQKTLMYAGAASLLVGIGWVLLRLYKSKPRL